MNDFDLKANRLWYLATPYRAHPEGMETAYKEAKQMMEFMLARGWNVFCPIHMSHNVCEALRDRDEYYWIYTIDKVYLQRSNGLIIVRMPGFNKSTGIAYERGFMDGQDKPVVETNFMEEPLIDALRESTNYW